MLLRLAMLWQLSSCLTTYHFPHRDVDRGGALLGLSTGVVALLLGVSSGVELDTGVELATGSREPPGGLDHVFISANLLKTTSL